MVIGIFANGIEASANDTYDSLNDLKNQYDANGRPYVYTDTMFFVGDGFAPGDGFYYKGGYIYGTYKDVGVYHKINGVWTWGTWQKGYEVINLNLKGGGEGTSVWNNEARTSLFFHVAPPSPYVIPTVQAVEEIPEVMRANLVDGGLLLVALTVLVTLLGVYLVPRLVYSFVQSKL